MSMADLLAPTTYHLMIDIETLATSDDAAILQIGYARFNLTGDLRIEGTSLTLPYLEQLDPASGRVVDTDTYRWWQSEAQETWKYLQIPNSVTLLSALRILREQILQADYYWAKSPSFDFRILRHAFKTNGMKRDGYMDFRREVDVRTIQRLNPSAYEAAAANPTAHSAFEDCVAQVRGVRAVVQSLSGLDL